MNAPTLRSASAVLAALALPWSLGAPNVASAAEIRIVGFATYRERIALPRGAAFEARLEREPRSDGPGETLARVRNERPGAVPIAFELAVDTRRLDPRRTYVIRASLYAEGRLRFTGTEAYREPAQDQENRITVLMRAATAEDAERDREWEADVEENGDQEWDDDWERDGDRYRDEDRGWDRRGSEASLGTLPGTYIGVVTCPDCMGIRHQINLLSGGAYMQRLTHFREGRDESVYTIGAWSLSRDGRTLTLDDGGPGASWSVRNRQTLRKLDRESRRTDSRQAYDLTRRATFEPMEPRVSFTGMFRYMADAPRFRDSRSGLQWPVAMSNDYRALERAYMENRRRPGSELRVSFSGRIELRPKTEGGGTEPVLVVERFGRVQPAGDGRESAPNAGLENTRWRPVRIDDRPVVLAGQAREPWIMLEPRAKRVTGHGGCNGFSGSYNARDPVLRFGQLLRTQMACPSLDTETAFLRALERTRRYRLRGPRLLELLDENDRVLARLEERSLR